MVNDFDVILKKFLKPYKFRLIRSYLSHESNLNMLDVGCGARASEIARSSLNLKSYDGVDNQVWQGNESSYVDIDKFFKIDVEKEPLNQIPDEYYDIIMVSHLIEHISNGEEVISKLCFKLRVGGIIYIETPSPKTLNLPSADGFANFYDDITHKRLYFPHEILNALINPNMQVLKYGIRRDMLRILIFSPIMLILNIVYFYPLKKRLNFKGLWDLFGVAQFWCARRIK